MSVCMMLTLRPLRQTTVGALLSLLQMRIRGRFRCHTRQRRSILFYVCRMEFPVSRSRSVAIMCSSIPSLFFCAGDCGLQREAVFLIRRYRPFVEGPRFAAGVVRIGALPNCTLLKPGRSALLTTVSILLSASRSRKQESHSDIVTRAQVGGGDG